MRALNRSAAIVRPREPYVTWATSVDGGAGRHEPTVRSHVSVYLVPPDPREEEEAAPLEEYFSRIFELELEGWHTDESTWPEHRDLATFLEWFEVVTESVVLDLGTGRLKVEEY